MMPMLFQRSVQLSKHSDDIPNLFCRPTATGRDREFEQQRSSHWRGANRFVKVLRLLYFVEPPFEPAPVARPNDSSGTGSVSTTGGGHRPQPLRC